MRLHDPGRGTTVFWSTGAVGREDRIRLMGHRPCVVWLTGLSGAGKSTIASTLEQKLIVAGHHAMVLDGDNLRQGLNRDLDFTDAARMENVRRVAQVARLMTDAGLIVITALISPFRQDRRTAREVMAAGEFLEVFVDTPLAECERRDPKGLYARARQGMIRNFTGVDAPYEPPESPDLRLDTMANSADELATQIIGTLRIRGTIPDGSYP